MATDIPDLILKKSNNVKSLEVRTILLSFHFNPNFTSNTDKISVTHFK